jgi:hypothetical protein
MQCRRKVLIVVSAAMLILAFLGLGEHHYFLPLFVRPEFMSRNMDFLHEPVEHGHFVWRNLYHNF